MGRYILDLIIGTIGIIVLLTTTKEYFVNRVWKRNQQPKGVNKKLSIVLISILIVIDIFAIPYVFSLWFDIPIIITRKYEYVEGYITEIKPPPFRDVGHIVVNDNIKLYGTVKHTIIKNYRKYKFQYLPHTHYIIKVEGIE